MTTGLISNQLAAALSASSPNKMTSDKLQSPIEVQNFTMQENETNSSLDKTRPAPINYKNGRKVEPKMFNYSNYYMHREKLPVHYHPLVQFLEETEVKYHNDNLYENSSIGFPTRAQLLREKVVHLPIIRDTPAERARYKRKVVENQQNIITSRKKYEFTTHDKFSSHYFLTGARFNRNDTIDSKLLNNYGIFINRNKPDLLYVKSAQHSLENIANDFEKMANLGYDLMPESNVRSKSIQVTPDLFIYKRSAQEEELNKLASYHLPPLIINKHKPKLYKPKMARRNVKKEEIKAEEPVRNAPRKMEERKNAKLIMKFLFESTTKNLKNQQTFAKIKNKNDEILCECDLNRITSKNLEDYILSEGEVIGYVNPKKVKQH